MVYISEAHPTDGWSIKSPTVPQIRQPKTFEERMDAARNFKKSISGKVKAKMVVDDMDNLANITFGASPERLVVLQNGKVAYLGGPGPFEYSIPELDAYLKKVI